MEIDNTTATLVAELEALLAKARAAQAQSAEVPPLLPMDPRFALPRGEREALLGEVIAPYHDGAVFVRPFWMVGLVGAMVGASVAEYRQAVMILGISASGSRPRESYVLGPDVAGRYWNEDLTSPGTNGWNPRGAGYFYDPELGDDENMRNWVACGCPKRNRYGEWPNGGIPQKYVDETRRGSDDRDLDQPGFPGSVRRGRHRGR